MDKIDAEWLKSLMSWADGWEIDYPAAEGFCVLCGKYPVMRVRCFDPEDRHVYLNFTLCQACAETHKFFTYQDEEGEE